MKTRNIFLALIATALSGVMVSCDDFLDREPTSQLAPETFFTDASHLQAYADKYYSSVLPGNSGNSYGIYANDQGTDNQIAANAPSYFCTGEWKVPNASGDFLFRE